MIGITVYGIPAPQGSKRHVGKGIMVESSAKVKPWREAVKYAALDTMAGAAKITGPVAIDVTFAFNKPKSAPKRRRTWPTTRSSGDLDKLLRSTFDALTDAGVMADDSQVVQICASKVFTDDHTSPLSSPGAVIKVVGIINP